ncbi:MULTISPECIES: Dabb family protein [unclassified Sphingomonas]|nr:MULTISPECIES: Dabb family protein [unclassified Sphingomonas]KQX25158.1 stress protein [Sphingomonas sp. Root1294]KQY66175.1 stress protein [Sphingomonas sp. Root50]KRB89895.1 stress protein [Sphingomonas sp. Root720]
MTAAAVAMGSVAGSPASAQDLSGTFVHHVYFWLKQPNSAGDRARLIDGLKTLSSVKTIKAHHIGVPAATDRPVIDKSYSVSWMLVFASKADQDSYQVDPIHLAFVEHLSPLWERVVVYDAEAID